MSGEFILISHEDPYGHDTGHPQKIELSFDAGGNFKRLDKSRIEEGSYLITPQQDLLLYVEKVNGDQRAAARIELYQITEEREDGLTLRDASFRKTIFRKR